MSGQITSKPIARASEVLTPGIKPKYELHPDDAGNFTPASYIRGLSDASRIVFEARQALMGGGSQIEGARVALDGVMTRIQEKRSEASSGIVVDAGVVLNETKLALAESERMVEIYKSAHADLRRILPAKSKQVAWLLNWSLLATFIAIAELAVIVIYALKMKGWL